MSTLVVGVPSEIKDNEKRVALTPDGVTELVHNGHQVVVQSGAGVGSRFPDDEYATAGAKILPNADEVFAAADLIVKVKEPVPAEYHRFRPGQQLFTYLHLAADRGLTEFLLERNIDSIAYETVQTSDRKLPLLTPMSEVAGRMSVQAAAHHLESPAGGAGILLGGVPGTPAAKVLIIGGGVSGTEAAKIALGMRAMVRVLDTNPGRLAYLSDIFGGRLDLVVPNRARTAAYVAEADVVIGAVLVPGAKAPKLVTREMIAAMRPGSVVVDIAIDQGGCFETSRRDDALRPHLHRGRRHPLLRGQHPRRGRPHLHAGSDLGDAALPRQGRPARRDRRRAGRPRPAPRPQHPRRQARQPARRRRPRDRLHRPRGGAHGAVSPRAGPGPARGAARSTRLIVRRQIGPNRHRYRPHDQVG